MKDLISKLTFGFLMAQFVPGVILVCSVSFVFVTFTGKVPQDVATAAYQSLDIWMEPVRQLLIFIALSIGGGMAIHGLHWSVLGFLETHLADRENGEIKKLKPVYDRPWHEVPLIIQILLGPVQIGWEIMLLLLRGRKIAEIAIEENVSAIPDDKMDAFSFLQDFYLSFAQFYAHTAYALLASFAAVLLSTLFSPGLSFSAGCAVALALTWAASGFFFVVSRIQLASLFRAEQALRESVGPQPAPCDPQESVGDRG